MTRPEVRYSAQLSMWATAPLARRSDPPTSKAAAPSTGHLSWLQGRILELHCDNHGGLTNDELAAMLSAEAYGPTVVKRTTELARKGRLVDSGRTRTTSRGKQAIVWQLSPDA